MERFYQAAHLLAAVAQQCAHRCHLLRVELMPQVREGCCGIRMLMLLLPIQVGAQVFHDRLRCHGLQAGPLGLLLQGRQASLELGRLQVQVAAEALLRRLHNLRAQVDVLLQLGHRSLPLVALLSHRQSRFSLQLLRGLFDLLVDALEGCVLKIPELLHAHLEPALALALEVHLMRIASRPQVAAAGHWPRRVARPRRAPVRPWRVAAAAHSRRVARPRQPPCREPK
mmetsp:Transcript_58239/g.118434  ORF Transcript_58239/g.118434 Transcript_58239/m.118434 type:complete len:227 (+) Transcript_58239:1945-2625(+)